jgi:3',5'-nucleoside bisphosphate phosphatase
MHINETVSKNGSLIDLHIHSTYSDGLFTPTEIIEHAKARQLKAISITDHDTVAASQSAAKLGVEHGIEVVSGIEMSLSCNGCEVHLLGYFFDDQSGPIKEYAEMLMGSRDDRARKIVKALQQQGMGISFEQVAEKANGSPIGRPHIAAVLIEEGHVFSAYEAFQKYLGEKKSADIPKDTVEPKKAIEMIKDAGGLTFIAHPATIQCCEEALKELVSYGLDGLETIHPKHNIDTQKHFHEVAQKYNLLESGGSDCHGGREGVVMIGKPPVPFLFLQRMKERLA